MQGLWFWNLVEFGKQISIEMFYTFVRAALKKELTKTKLLSHIVQVRIQIWEQNPEM
jgi:hypothetical protein